MSAALAIATILVAAGAIPATPQNAGLVQLVRDACVETGLERDAFERLARERRWRPARITSDTRPSGGWNLVFLAGDANVMLSQVPDFGAADPSLGSICTVTVGRAPASLEDEVSTFAASLGLESEGAVAELPVGAAPFRTWSVFGGLSLTYAGAADGRAAISLSRQIVINETAPASPPGN